MPPNFHLRIWAYATLATLITGCVVIPIPASQDTVVFGQDVAEDGVRPKVAIGEDLREVKARFGEPVVDFGPRRVLVYLWTVKKGVFVWFLGSQAGAIGGVEPWTASHLLIVAFDPDGKALKAGTMDFKSFNTIAEHVRNWLVSNDLASRVVSPRVGVSTRGGPFLFIYRPSTSPCPFPTFDANIFKPSVAIDGNVVGDLAKGEYLAVDINAGAHAITIDPYPSYRSEGMKGSFFVQDVRSHRVPTTVIISVDTDRSIYIETYLCTGMGKTEMHATVRDELTALQALRNLVPAW